LSVKSQLKKLIFGDGFKARRFIGGHLKGMWSFFDLSNDTQMWRGIYEVAQQDWIVGATKQGAVCLDIGAAEGYFSLLFAREAGVTGKVFAFEPSERKDYINESVNMNKSLSLAPVTLYSEFVVGPSTKDLTGVIIDDVVRKEGLDRVDVVKIDVDGGEMDVLEGMRATIEKFHPNMSVELHSPELYAQVKTFLEGYGYSMTLVDPPAYERRPIPFNKFYFSQLPT
jgi:hypothetical protein